MNKEVHILYVEDNEGDVELMTMAIERYFSTLNIVLDVAETVGEAKSIFQADKHIIALVDWNLPDGEGIEVLKFIRETPNEMPIFLLSGVNTSEHIKAATAYNPTACLEKNYSKSFFEQIEKCILAAN